MTPKISVSEQETIIILSREDARATIYSTDTRVRNRLSKLYSDKLTRQYTREGEPIAEEYTVDPRLISFRKALPRKRELSEQEKEELRGRLDAMRKVAV